MRIECKTCGTWVCEYIPYMAAGAWFFECGEAAQRMDDGAIIYIGTCSS